MVSPLSSFALLPQEFVKIFKEGRAGIIITKIKNPVKSISRHYGLIKVGYLYHFLPFTVNTDLGWIRQVSSNINCWNSFRMNEWFLKYEINPKSYTLNINISHREKNIFHKLEPQWHRYSVKLVFHVDLIHLNTKWNSLDIFLVAQKVFHSMSNFCLP